jgi:membrane protease subunit HflC
MVSEQNRIATRYRAEGKEDAEKIKAETDREVRELLAQAYQESQIIRGKGEAEAAGIYAEAYQRDPEYYEFSRTQDSYSQLIGEDTTLILSSDSPIFRHLFAPPEKN